MTECGLKSSRQKLSLGKKCCFSVLTCISIVLLAELLLYSLGVESVRATHDPFVGFDNKVEQFVRRGDHYETNPLKLAFFNPQTFPAEKSPREYRIFCLGGSTTFGHPYEAPFAFGSWLEAYLKVLVPRREWRVINCGGISYASYRIANMMDELTKYEPDLFIVYSGHNEFLEERTYGEIKRTNPSLRQVVSWASYSRIYSKTYAWLRGPPPEPAQLLTSEVNTQLDVVGLDAYQRDEEWRAGVLHHFQISLERIVRAVHNSDADVILVQPASNLKDFSPFKSEHSELSPAERKTWTSLVDNGRRKMSAGRYQAAIHDLEQACAIDPLHALGLWELGRAILKAGREEEAIAYFVRSADEDVCPLRATSECSRIIADVGRRWRVPVVDYPRLLAEKYGAREAIGKKCFQDHVHLTLTATNDLAAALCEKLAQMNIIPSFEPSKQLHQQIDQKMRAQLNTTDVAQAHHALAMTLNWAGKQYEALPLAESAARELPQNANVVSFLGRVLELLGRDQAALEAFEQAIAAEPNDPTASARMGNFLGTRGQYARAKTYLERAVLHTPQSAPIAVRLKIHLQLGDCLHFLGDTQAAQAVYRKAAKIAPNSPDVRLRLGQ